MLQECNLHWHYLDTETYLCAPWYSLPCLEWLKTQRTKHWNVFEYGCGYSTLWWRVNCRSLTSVDHDECWAKATSAYWIPPECNDEVYIEHIRKRSDFGNNLLFDCVIIDGIHREDCARYCLPYIKPGGYLIIDNWEDFDHAAAPTNETGEMWQHVIYKQPNHTRWETAVFQKPVA